MDFCKFKFCPVLLALLFCIVVALPAQTSKKTVRKKAATTAVARKKTGNTRKTAQKGGTQKSKKAGKTSKAKSSSTAKPAVTVKSLQNQRQQIQNNIKAQQQRLRKNERDVQKRLQNLLVINNEIVDKRRTIDTIRNDINTLSGNINVLDKQVLMLQKELDERKRRFMKSMRYMHRNRSIQSQLMFIFSAKNFSQMYRRLRFVREYAAYQRAQGEAVKWMQEQVQEASNELTSAKRQKNDLLNRGEQEQKALEGKQVEQQQVVSTLQQQQKTIQRIIDKEQKRDAELNARIDKLIAEEVARAKARAEAERKRKAAEAAAKKRAEELARKKAAAEAAARENARRIAEAKEKEEKAKAAARAAARKSAQEKARAEKAAREAEQARRAAERKAAAEANEHKLEMAKARKEAAEEYAVSSEDRRLSGNFESNKGRLPMPITGPYKIVHSFGVHRVEGLKGSTTYDTKGIDLKGQPGARVRCVFDGEVTVVFGYGGSTVVIVRHGSYLSVYTNLATVSVSRGQHVSTNQTLGTVGSDGIMQFQLRRGTAKLNPSSWLSR